MKANVAFTHADLTTRYRKESFYKVLSCCQARFLFPFHLIITYIIFASYVILRDGPASEKNMRIRLTPWVAEMSMGRIRSRIGAGLGFSAGPDCNV